MPVTRRSVLATAATGTGALALTGWSWTAADQASAAEAATAEAAEGAGRLDLIDFGNADSETAHDFTGPDTEVADGHAGDRARVAKPLATTDIKGGDLRFTLAVDPVHQNYLTVKCSPITRELDGRTLAATPYLRLVRDVSTHQVHGQVSVDGTTWVTVASLLTPFPYAVYAGLAATGDATFAQVAVDRLKEDAVLVAVGRDADTVTVRWNKPEDALTFTVARSTDGDSWETVESDTRAFAYEDTGLRHGERYYRVSATLVDGGTRTSAPTVAVAETLAGVLARARKTDPAEWTKKSYAAFVAEVDRIEGDTGKDDDARIDAVYAAYELLVSRETLLRRTQVTASMVAASTIEWPGRGTKESNGWKGFDGDTATYPDTLAAESWIDIDAGDVGPLVVDKLRIFPRANYAARATGTVLLGSSDGGLTWTDLHTIGTTSEGTWHEATLPSTASYPLLRFYDGHNGRCNLAEIEFWYYAAEEEA
ncbi:fibronectin type III domain-containing protein [Streptomyces regalis]|uniref:F5/8 type C domain-containing protein n=1 Tax=Streptomyces regalis TaxID=68262 RepID=A0A101J8V2_9ACTN|nr:fibronectin type III domain-containing protein [Streptomyces regalis]KUL22310.1 hypothetical protein ADL12_42470 [Streptomyces regalis]